MGGWGRTGMFLALLAKVCGDEDPVMLRAPRLLAAARVETTGAGPLRRRSSTSTRAAPLAVRLGVARAIRWTKALFWWDERCKNQCR